MGISLRQRIQRLEWKVGPRIRELFQRGRKRPTWPARLAQTAEILEERTLLSALTVNTTGDNIDADGSLTLREAVLLVNNAGDSNAAFGRDLTAGEQAQIDAAESFGTNDTILFDTNLAGGTITLAGSELAITTNVSVFGLGADQLAIDAGGLSRIFHVSDGDDLFQSFVFIGGLTLTGGSTSEDGGAIRNFENLTVDSSILTGNTAGGFGGAIDNLGNLTASFSTFSENFAELGGAGINNAGTATITNGILVQNFTNGAGGGIRNDGTGLLTLSGGTIASNTADFGGGIDNSQGSLTMADALITQNSAELNGGGINNNGGTIQVTGGSLSANTAQFGGGMLNVEGDLIVTNGFLAGNTAQFGGGIDNFRGFVEINNSTITANSAEFGGGLRNLEGELNVTGGAITGNTASSNGGGIANVSGTLRVTSSNIRGNSAVNGGGIRNESSGTAIISNSQITQNSAEFGGGIDNIQGQLTVTASTFEENTAVFNGGGIQNNIGNVAVFDSNIAFNSGQFGGGLLNLQGGMLVSGSTISRNNAQFAGGIDNFQGSLTVLNSTISSNFASDNSGGIRNLEGDLSVTNSTIVLNASFNATGGLGAFGTETLANTIVAGNFATTNSDIADTVETAGNNLIGDPNSAGGLADGVNGNLVGDGMGGVIDIATVLDPVLRNNGGPTQTHALVAGSPAIDAGNDILAANAFLVTDQRGVLFPRFAGTSVDIGAYEVQDFIVPANLVVDTLEDVVDGDLSPGDVSLREAIDLANSSPGLNTITFDASLAGGTIFLNGSELILADDVTIMGLGENLLTLDASGLSRIFRIDDGDFLSEITASISDLTLTGGFTQAGGGAIRNFENLILEDTTFNANSAIENGGAIESLGVVDVARSVFSNNSARNGGGIFSSNTLTVNSSTFAFNSAFNSGGGIENLGTLIVDRSAFFQNGTQAFDPFGGRGGAINNNPGGTVFLSNSRLVQNSANAGGAIASTDGSLGITSTIIAGNNASFDGGGILNDGGTAIIQGSTFVENFAFANGGGIHSSGNLILLNSTVSGNTVNFQGGGIYNSLGGLTVTNSTIVFNTATFGEGGGIATAGNETLANTIVAGNTALNGNDIFTIFGEFDPIEFGTSNLIGDSNSAGGLADGVNGNIVGDGMGGLLDVTTVLDPILRHNGGLTPTHALIAGSPAIDAGDSFQALAAGLVFDQRGVLFPRNVGAAVDIGAYEVQDFVVPLALVVDTLEDVVDGDLSEGDFSLREALDLANSSRGLNIITFHPDLTGGTIILQGIDLAIADDLIITGLGQSNLTIDADGLSRIFNINDGDFDNQALVSISGLTLAGGSTPASGGAIVNVENLALADSSLVGNSATFGGAINNGGLLSITGGNLAGNSAVQLGGAINNISPISDFGEILTTAVLTLSNSTVRFNFAGTAGGAINNNAGLVEMINSEVAFNATDSFGGGIENFQGTLIVRDDSRITNNIANFGGGLDNFGGSVTISDSMVSQNSAFFFGGGINNFGDNDPETDAGTLMVTDSEIAENLALNSGGGIENIQGDVTLVRSKVSKNIGASGGAGIDNFSGNLLVNSSLIDQNTLTDPFGIGGGINNFFSNATIEYSTIEKNSAFLGGGVLSLGQLTVFASTVSENSAESDGGGMLVLGMTEVTNSTISQNTANGFGAGIFNLDGLTALNSVTLFGNRADADGDGQGTGGGLFTFNDNRTDTFLFNTIVLGNVQGTMDQSIANDIANTGDGKNITANSTNNLIGDPGSAGGLVDGFRTLDTGTRVFNIVGDGIGNPLDASKVLDPNLEFNGGPTRTHKLVANSKAINAGRDVVDVTPPQLPGGVVVKQGQGLLQNNQRTARDGTVIQATPEGLAGAVQIEIPEFDQRGEPFARITGGQIDIGAYEIQFHIDLAFGTGTGIEAQVILRDSEFSNAGFGQEFATLKPYTVEDPDPTTRFEPPLVFTGGVRVALGDVNGDGFNDIITAPGAGGGPHVRVFDGRTFENLPLPGNLANFFAYGANFTGGVFVAAGDLNDDGFADIITGAGEGGGPHVRAWSGADGSEIHSFFAYNPLFRGGVRVAAGFINNDVFADIITGAGPGGGPHVRVFDGNTRADLLSFWAYEPTYTGGVYVASNNTGIGGGAVIVTGSGHKIGGSTVGLFTATGANITYFQTPIFAGVTVATFDFNRDGFNDYVTSTGQFASGQVIVFSGQNQPPFSKDKLPFTPTLFSDFPYGNLQLGGVFVAGSTSPHDVLVDELEALDDAFVSLAETGLE